MVRGLSKKFPHYYRVYFAIAYYTNSYEESIKYCDKALSYDSNYVRAESYKMKIIGKMDRNQGRALESKLKQKYEHSEEFWMTVGEKAER